VVPEQRQDHDDTEPEAAAAPEQPWMTRGVGGIGSARFLADVDHEFPTALMASLVTATLGGPASALGLMEGMSDGLAGAAGSSANPCRRPASPSPARGRRLHPDRRGCHR
jgi:hypothetical protein